MSQHTNDPTVRREEPVAYVTTTDRSTRERSHESHVDAVPRDRVRWGPVLAGLFAALSTLVLLAVLGVAIGLSSLDADDSAKAFGIGAGIWSIVSTIIAFVVGGYVAASTAATDASHTDRNGKLKDDNGVLQGAMVWAVAIPLLIYFIAGGIGSALGVAGKTAAVAAQTTAAAAGDTAATVADQRINRAGGTEQAADQAGDQVKAATQRATNAASDAMNSVRQSVTPERVEAVADKSASAVWGTLIAMLVGLGASVGGGYLGGKSRSAVTA